MEFVGQAYRLETQIGVDVVVLRQNISGKPQLAMKAFDCLAEGWPYAVLAIISVTYSQLIVGVDYIYKIPWWDFVWVVLPIDLFGKD